MSGTLHKTLALGKVKKKKKRGSEEKGASNVSGPKEKLNLETKSLSECRLADANTQVKELLGHSSSFVIKC